MELKFKHFVFLNVLDVLTTYIGLTYLHLREANAFASGLFQNYGLIFALVGMKLIGLMVIYLIFINYPYIIKISKLNIKSEIVNTWFLRTSCLLFIVVVLNNSYQMIRVIF